jgi:putative ABC transport system permease protein
MIVRRSLRRHALSTTITVLSTALGAGLVMAVFAIGRQSKDAFAGGAIGFDAVLGARGSQLQLVLNTIFHLETSPGNVPWSLYQELKQDPRVDAAIPYAVGDNFEGFRVVGTTPEIFTKLVGPRGEALKLAVGEPFRPDHYEAVLGASVARETRTRAGENIHLNHGIHLEGSAEHDEDYKVRGILAPTNSPADRVVWIPIEGVFRMGGHVLRGDGEEFHAREGELIPDENKAVSAVLLRFQGGSATGIYFDNLVNRQGKTATLAWPISRSIAELFDKLGWMSRVLGLVAYLVVAVAAGSILASLYNTMNERRREFAILRALGARKRTVFSAIVLEASAIAALGAALGFAVYLAILGATAAVVKAQTGVVLTPWAAHPALGWTPLGMVLIGALAGCLPAWKAYATDVASNLAPQS